MRTEERERIKPVTSLREFFKNSVTEAMRRQGLSVADDTEYYVVNLLTLFARSESLFDRTPDGLELKPVALVLSEAVGKERVDEKNFALQRVGDVSLFIAGFMSDGLSQKLVDVDYYIFMGGSAYGTLSDNVRGSRRGKIYSRVFAELAEKFQRFVDVLADIRDLSRSSERDILRLYDTWLRTGSQRAEKALRALGIEPTRMSDNNLRH